MSEEKNITGKANLNFGELKVPENVKEIEIKNPKQVELGLHLSEKDLRLEKHRINAEKMKQDKDKEDRERDDGDQPVR